MKTYMATPSTIERKWYVVDAADKTLGRLAAEVAKVLRGKHKPTFTPNQDTGDYVIVINADKVKLTGKKLVQKIYFRHSGYLGGDKYTKAGELPSAVWFPTIVWATRLLENCLYTLVLNILMLHKSLKC